METAEVKPKRPGRKKWAFLAFLLASTMLFLALFLLKASVSIKTLVHTPAPPAMLWAILAETDHQVFWRSNLINIVKNPDTNRGGWKELLKGDRERRFNIIEQVPGERLVKRYEGDFLGQETMTIIILPEAGGSQLALIDTIVLRSPLAKLKARLHLSDQAALFHHYNEFTSQFTNYLAKRVSHETSTPRALQTN